MHGIRHENRSCVMGDGTQNNASVFNSNLYACQTVINDGFTTGTRVYFQAYKSAGHMPERIIKTLDVNKTLKNRA